MNGIPKDVPSVCILKFIDKCDCLSVILTCKRFRDTILAYVFTPWANNGKGLIHACDHNYVKYYRKWSKVACQRWKPMMKWEQIVKVATHHRHKDIIKEMLKLKLNIVTTHAIYESFSSELLTSSTLKFLISVDKRIWPSVMKSASASGSISIMKLLVDLQFDVSCCIYCVIRVAIINEKKYSVEFLLSLKLENMSRYVYYAFQETMFYNENGHLNDILELVRNNPHFVSTNNLKDLIIPYSERDVDSGCIEFG